MVENNTVLTQDGFNTYIRKLKLTNTCMYMKSRGLDFCMCDFVCPYQGKDTYVYANEDRRECNRDKSAKMKLSLGNKN